MTEALRERLQAGVILVDHYLRGHVADLADLDTAMVANLRQWVTASASVLTRHTTNGGTVQCGPLRRDDDGSWWWLDHLLGHDDDPSPALERLESSVRIVALALGDALETATQAIDAASNRTSFQIARRALGRLDHWKRSGVW